MSQLGLQLQAATRALADAGLRAQDVDGVMPFPNLGTAEVRAGQRTVLRH